MFIYQNLPKAPNTAWYGIMSIIIIWITNVTVPYNDSILSYIVSHK